MRSYLQVLLVFCYGFPTFSVAAGQLGLDYHRKPPADLAGPEHPGA